MNIKDVLNNENIKESIRLGIKNSTSCHAEYFNTDAEGKPQACFIGAWAVGENIKAGKPILSDYFIKGGIDDFIAMEIHPDEFPDINVPDEIVAKCTRRYPPTFNVATTTLLDVLTKWHDNLWHPTIREEMFEAIYGEEV